MLEKYICGVWKRTDSSKLYGFQEKHYYYYLKNLNLWLTAPKGATPVN